MEIDYPENKSQKNLYSLKIIKDWANGNDEWMLVFLELLVQEIQQKNKRIYKAVQNNNTKKLAFEIHQLASQLALLENAEINNLILDIERNIIKNKCLKDVDSLIFKSKELIEELKKDFNF